MTPPPPEKRIGHHYYELADLDPTEVAFCGEDIELLRWIKSLFG